jgi:hypothetical protein
LPHTNRKSKPLSTSIRKALADFRISGLKVYGLGKALQTLRVCKALFEDPKLLDP